MGSKQYMLRNGLADLLRKEIPKAKRFIDPFAGSCAVVGHVAEKYSIEVISSDLQKYSEVIARSILSRTQPIDLGPLEKEWIQKAEKSCERSKLFKLAKLLEDKTPNTVTLVKRARDLCTKKSNIGPVWNAYGGNYYSPSQALSIDYLIKILPKKEPDRSVCLAALIKTASKSASAPGHTAQPLQPKTTGNVNKLIRQAWERNIFEQVLKDLHEINGNHAKKIGRSFTLEANDLLQNTKHGDLVFLDPPYSGVQYSRFYHVLETIARGECGSVEGVGRYPSLLERPQSKYSNAGQSKVALENMMNLLSEKGAKVIFTFPEGKCSNGLSGDIVKQISKKYFDIEKEGEHIHGTFSTMGGNNKNRPAKMDSVELLLLLTPKVKPNKLESYRETDPETETSVNRAVIVA